MIGRNDSTKGHANQATEKHWEPEETSASAQSVPEDTLDKQVGSSTPGPEGCLGNNQQAARIVWKAYIQTPVRLVGSDVWPIPLPESYGTNAPSPPPCKGIDRTVRDYKLILPEQNDEHAPHRRSDSRLSRMTAGGRTMFSTVKRTKVHRFLKTIPPPNLQFPPLQRSQHFEQFIQQPKYHRLSKSQSEEAIAPRHGSKRKDPPSRKLSIRRESHVSTSRSQSDNTRKSSTFSSRDSVYSRLRLLSLFDKSLSKLSFTFPIYSSRRDTHRSSSDSFMTQTEPSKETPENVAKIILPEAKSIKAVASETGNDDGLRRPDVTTFEKMVQKNQRFVLPSFLHPHIMDMEEVYTGADILDAKIRDHDLKLPIHPETADDLRKLYHITILKDASLKDLLKSARLDTLPKQLRHLVRMGSLFKQVNAVDIGFGEREALERQKQYCEVKEPSADTAIADVQNLWIEAKVFTSELFTTWVSQMKPNTSYGKLSIMEFDTLLRHTGRLIRSNNTVPTSDSRCQLGTILATCAACPRYLPVLWARIYEWLDSLLSCLYSRERTVREQACYILAYLFTEPNLVEGIRHCPHIDIGFDTTAAILQAIPISHGSFIHYFCLLAIIIEGCPMSSILDAVMEIGPISSSALVNHLWPRLLYYALRYWHGKHILRDRILLKTLNESIERAYVKGISRKNARLAQIQLSRRFKVLTKPTTVWLDEWKKFKL